MIKKITETRKLSKLSINNNIINANINKVIKEVCKSRMRFYFHILKEWLRIWKGVVLLKYEKYNVTIFKIKIS